MGSSAGTWRAPHFLQNTASGSFFVPHAAHATLAPGLAARSSSFGGAASFFLAFAFAGAASEVFAFFSFLGGASSSLSVSARPSARRRAATSFSTLARSGCDSSSSERRSRLASARYLVTRAW